MTNATWFVNIYIYTYRGRESVLTKSHASMRVTRITNIITAGGFVFLLFMYIYV